MSDPQMEVGAIINSILLKQNDISLNADDVLKDLRLLRNLCARGSEIQFQIASNEDLQTFLQSLLFVASDNAESIKQLQTIGWQLMANMIVNNPQSQTIVWQKHGSNILQQCLDTQMILDRKVDVMLMIVYNVMRSASATSLVQLPLVLRAVVCVWHSILEQKCSLQFDFLHFIFEEFLVKDGRNTVKCYAQLSTNDRLTFLDYLINYLRQDSPNGLVHTFLLQHISKEFKIKSDCILRVASLQEVDKMKPQEAYALLRCIASASGSENYSELYATDHSLFLNVSSLLRCLVQASKESANTIFTPMNKLEEVAPTSTISPDYQSEISYELKTLLVRCIANLLYNNDTNKGYCLDTQLMPALFECTNMDARNPLMKEWSILAIRNACIGCPEIQQVIANLTSQGPAKNEILTELNLDLGSLRINPSKE
ncbi:ataxin-10 [Lucilia sericata]|uniref:ataxin-10 n=1 Tax=Lucilia sericata TaxID=13632 RepID=UPI0018A861B3|nr:ataxin-10 [Lucilia sericata]